jgi:hypothetical protein
LMMTKEEETTETHDFKSSRNHPLHSRYDWGGMLDYMYWLD